MQYYSVTKLDDGYLLKKKSIDLSFFNKIETKDGDIKLVRKDITEIYVGGNVPVLKNYNFNKMKVIGVKINGTKLVFSRLIDFLSYIYKFIGNGAKIIQNTVLNIQTLPVREFIYSKSLGISYPHTDNNLLILEIFKQSIANNFVVEIDMKVDEIILHLNSLNKRKN